MPIGIVGNDGLALLSCDKLEVVYQQEGRKSIITRVCAVFFIHADTKLTLLPFSNS